MWLNQSEINLTETLVKNMYLTIKTTKNQQKLLTDKTPSHAYLVFISQAAMAFTFHCNLLVDTQFGTWNMFNVAITKTSFTV